MTDPISERLRAVENNVGSLSTLMEQHCKHSETITSQLATYINKLDNQINEKDGIRANVEKNSLVTKQIIIPVLVTVAAGLVLVAMKAYAG